MLAVLPVLLSEAGPIVKYIGDSVFHTDAVAAFKNATGIDLENTPSGQVAKLYSQLTPDQKQALEDECKKFIAFVKTKSMTKGGRLQLVIGAGIGCIVSIAIMALWAIHPAISASS